MIKKQEDNGEGRSRRWSEVGPAHIPPFSFSVVALAFAVVQHEPQSATHVVWGSSTFNSSDKHL